MKIDVTKLEGPKTVTISGQEPWLRDIYSHFIERESQRIHGLCHFTPISGGCIQLAGHIQYNPTVACSRCAADIPWPIQAKLSGLYVPSISKHPAERDLTAQELEEYPIVDDEIDLSQAILDAVMTALPSRFVMPDDDGNCRICLQDLSSEQVFSSQPRPCPEGGVTDEEEDDWQQMLSSARKRLEDD